MHLRNDDLVDKLEVHAGGKTLLRAEQDAVLTVPQYIPQSTPLGEGDGGARHYKERPVRKVFTDRRSITVQHRCMPHADGYNFFRPPGKGFHNGHLLERRLAFVFLHAVRGGADAQKQCDLLNEPHQRVLSAVSGRAVIFALDAVELLQHDIVDLPLLREKRDRHLMDTADVLSRDLFKGAGDDRLSQQPIQFVGVVDVLISLSHAKNGDLFRQMGVCEQAVALFISGDRHCVIGIFLVLHIRRPFIVAVKRPTPRDHVDGIVVEQLQLRCKLRDIVPRAGAGSQELIFAAAKAGQHGKRLLGAGVGDVVALIKNKLDFIAKLLDIAPDLLFVLADLVQRQDHKIARSDALQVSQPLHKHIGKTRALQNHIPVVADGDGAGNDPYTVDSSHFHAVLPRENGGGCFAAALFPLQEGIPLLERQVDIVALERIQVDVSMILGVPILKATDPVSKLRVFGHLGKGLLLIVILPAFPAQQPLIARKPLRLIVQHRLIDRHRRTHLVRQELCHFPAVCLVDKAVFLLDQTNFVPLRLGVLAA